MSLIKAIKAQLGLSVTPANNFTFDASADNGTMKLARESGQDIMTVDATGKADFSVGILGFSVALGGTGHIKFPAWLGNLLLQWGNGTTAAGSITLTFSTPFGTVYSAVAVAQSANTVCAVNALGNSSLTIFTHVGSTGNAINNDVRYFAIGVAP